MHWPVEDDPNLERTKKLVQPTGVIGDVGEENPEPDCFMPNENDVSCTGYRFPTDLR